MPDIKTFHYPSPCGTLVLGSFENFLCLCDWEGSPLFRRNLRTVACRLNADFSETSFVRMPTVLQMAVGQLNEYFSSRRQIFDLPLILTGTEFQKAVWRVLTDIPFGETRTYAAVAAASDNPRGVRAVARAIGANRLSIIVPCHRVIGTDHSLTGYAGGLPAKHFLLSHEEGIVNL